MMLLLLVDLECCHVEESARSYDKQSKRYRRRPSWPSVRPPSWGCRPRLFTFHLPSYSLTVGSLPLRSWIWRGDLTTKWEYWDKSQGSLGRDEWSFRVQPFLAQIFFFLVWLSESEFFFPTPFTATSLRKLKTFSQLSLFWGSYTVWSALSGTTPRS